MKTTRQAKAAPVAAPCVCVKFDAQGNVIAQETVTRPAIRITDYTPDTVTNTLRVMAEQETGEEIFVSYAHRRNVDAIEAQARASHPEWRNVWSERIPADEGAPFYERPINEYRACYGD